MSMNHLHWRIMKCIRKAAEKRVLPDRATLIAALEEEVRAMILEEREACAKISEWYEGDGASVASMIRTRGPVV